MAKKDKIFLPMSVGGLIRYPEEEKEDVNLKTTEKNSKV